MLTNEQISVIETTIKTCLRAKFQNYNPESSNMPFHYRLLGKDRLALYSFIHSLNTSFGTAIFEPVAKVIGETKFENVIIKYNPGKWISEGSQIVIQRIIDDIANGQEEVDKRKEIELIRSSVKNGTPKKTKTVKADIFLKDSDGSVHLFDLKTAKPNISSFKDHKRTLLEWIAIELFENPELDVNSYIAIPYNPYAPKPYERWTMRGMLDLNNELKVAEEFWEFLGGEGTYDHLLQCFENVGIELRPEIDEYFSRFK